MPVSQHEIALFRSSGAVAIRVSPECRLRLRAALDADRAAWPMQEELSGLHNPFGRGAQLVDSWALLDIAEKGEIAENVIALLGPDVILWDSELYPSSAALAKSWPGERELWPVEPLAGLVVVVPLSPEPEAALFIDIAWLTEQRAARLPQGPAYALRYMPATSHFNRDPHFASNRKAAERRPLVNYTNRPIWLIHGEDRANNDFVTGFAPTALSWAAPGAAAKLRSP